MACNDTIIARLNACNRFEISTYGEKCRNLPLGLMNKAYPCVTYSQRAMFWSVLVKVLHDESRDSRENAGDFVRKLVEDNIQQRLLTYIQVSTLRCNCVSARDFQATISLNVCILRFAPITQLIKIFQKLCNTSIGSIDIVMLQKMFKLSGDTVSVMNAFQL
jgi:hypothetical protein